MPPGPFGVLIVLLLFFFVGIPVTKAIGNRLARLIAGAEESTADSTRLRKEVDRMRMALEDSDQRLSRMETRLDFYEQLLEQRRPPPSLGAGDAQGGPAGSTREGREDV